MAAYRPFDLLPGTRVRFEVHGRAGERLLIDARVDGVPEVAGNMAQRVRLVDAVARILEDDATTVP